MNKVMFMGRLTRDPEVRYGQDGDQTAVGRFSLAVDRKYKREGQPEADFFNCVTFGKQAQFVERYLRKGMKLLVIGRIENNNYVGRDGNKVYSVQVMVDEMEFVESKSASENRQNHQTMGQGQPAGDGFMRLPDDVEDEELPFA